MLNMLFENHNMLMCLFLFSDMFNITGESLKNVPSYSLILTITKQITETPV